MSRFDWGFTHCHEPQKRSFDSAIWFTSDGSDYRIYTNPATINEKAAISVERFHENTWCSLSERNMCKGAILEDHIAHSASLKSIDSGGSQSSADWSYKRVVFVGDGFNDYCPSLRLRPQDLICARQNFPLHQNLAKNPASVKATVFLWTTGQDILDHLAALY